MTQPTIITIKATKLLDIYNDKVANNKPLYLDARNKYKFGQVIKQTDTMDECPLLYQLVNSDTFKESKTDTENTRDWLHDKLFIMDFNGVFKRDPGSSMSSRIKYADLILMAENIISNGLDIQFSKDKIVHFVPFDKSGNMSRQSRITFINVDYYEELNRRLNLDIDFSKIKVILSKFYAYRGLYLSSSNRVSHKKFEVTPETLVIIKDNRRKSKENKYGNKEPVMGHSFAKEVPIVTAEKGKLNTKEETQIWNFSKPEIVEIEDIKTPFDGVGIISPDYAKYINESLNIEGASSFQVRMPFVKGMLHCVDFKGFLSEKDAEGMEQDVYEYEDAFGITRDLKKAQILLTESMFKGMKWLGEYCKNNHVDDPMEYYCKEFNKYEHALYISGTNLPYGHSEYTHLNYQFLNTLNLNDEQFERIIKKHTDFINDPKTYICKWNSSESIDYDDRQLSEENSAWKKALAEKSLFENDKFINKQIDSTRKGLITKIANGKITVAGQVRFLCRDLMPVLACLIKDEDKVSKFYRRVLFNRFYMPFEESAVSCLEYSRNYAFFRSPHLSRNEECMLKPFVKPENVKNMDGIDKKKKYDDYLGMYDKYFGHLTGVVMVPRGSVVPECLGGADFDGDLVSVVYDEDVVEAVARSCYDKWKRKLPVVKIPDTKSDDEDQPVPEYVPFVHILNTFSNSIGLLSNLAIKIGQMEYGRNVENKTSYDNAPACWKCTVLTGLEIDAAKNGIHPDLNSIGMDLSSIKKEEYLIFLKIYDRFRKLYDFDFDKLQVNIADNKLEFIMGDYKKECTIHDKDYGTYINELPYIFEKEFNNYKKESGKKNSDKGLKFVYDDNYPKKIKEDYIKDIQDVFALYLKYKNLIISINKELNKTSYGIYNLNKLVAKKYDEDKAERINADVIPKLVEAIDKAIPGDVSVKTIRNNIVDMKWQFQPKEKRPKVIEKIVGNDFKTKTLGNAEQQLLFSFSEQGYKVLWYVVDEIDKRRIKSFDELRNNCKVDSISNPKLTELINKLEEIALDLYYFKTVDAEKDIYALCINKLKDIVYSENKLKDDARIGVMYETVGNNVETARFFWDMLSWDEIKKCKVVGEK